MTRARPLEMFLPVALGLAVGLGTAVLQQHLGRPWHPLANSASPWLTTMFIAGATFDRPLAAALGGLATALLELAGYYVAVVTFGWSFLGGAWVLLWLFAGLVAGPLFGWAGSRWLRARRLSGLSSALLPAAWFTEALVLFDRFGVTAPAELFATFGACSVLVLGLRGRKYLEVALGTIVVLPAGVLGEVVLAMLYRQFS